VAALETVRKIVGLRWRECEWLRQSEVDVCETGSRIRAGAGFADIGIKEAARADVMSDTYSGMTPGIQATRHDPLLGFGLLKPSVRTWLSEGGSPLMSQ